MEPRCVAVEPSYFVAIIDRSTARKLCCAHVHGGKNSMQECESVKGCAGTFSGKSEAPGQIAWIIDSSYVSDKRVRIGDGYEIVAIIRAGCLRCRKRRHID